MHAYKPKATQLKTDSPRENNIENEQFQDNRNEVSQLVQLSSIMDNSPKQAKSIQLQSIADNTQLSRKLSKLDMR